MDIFIFLPYMLYETKLFEVNNIMTCTVFGLCRFNIVHLVTPAYLAFCRGYLDGAERFSHP